MKDKRGFTLIELLVVITIMGIITVLALPGVQQLQARNQNKKFESYSDTLEDAGKLYVDSYSEDMFGLTGNGCYDISFQDLSAKTLIKNYETNGITCDNDKTFVHVERNANKYTYAISLYCTKDGKEVYNKVLSKCSENAMTDLPTIRISYENLEGSNNWSKTKKIAIKLSAKEGFNPNIGIKYGWSTDKNTLPTELTQYNFRNESGETTLTFTTTVSNMNGEYYLFIDGDEVVDVRGRFAQDAWSSEVLRFDSVAPNTPVLENSKNGVWAGASYVNAGSYVIKATSSDNISGIRYYQYRYPNSENVWHTYSQSATNNFTTTAFTEERNEIVEIRACDYADNCSEIAQNNIMIDKTAPTCSITKSGTGGPTTYTSVVTLTLNVSNPGIVQKSSVSYGLVNNSTATYNSISSETQGATNGVTWYGFVRDAAGNTNTCNTGNFKVSLKPPVITFSLSGSTSTATCVDGNTGAPIAISSGATKTLSPSSLKHTVTCTNTVGQSTTSSYTYKVNSKYICTKSCTHCDTCHGSNCGGCCGKGGHPCSYSCNCSEGCCGGYTRYTYSK